MCDLPSQMLPEQLNDIQLRRIGWQLTDDEAVGIALQDALGDLAAVNDEVIEHQYDLGTTPALAGTVGGDYGVEQGAKTGAVLALADNVGDATRHGIHGTKTVAFLIGAGRRDFALGAAPGPAAGDAWQQMHINLVLE